METTAFVLGMLTITLVAMISVIVVGIVKIMKLQKHVKDLSENQKRIADHLYRILDDHQSKINRTIDDNHSEVWREFERAGRDVTLVEQTLMNQINQAEQRSTSYVDSRIDKLIDNYFGIVESKKIIKG